MARKLIFQITFINHTEVEVWGGGLWRMGIGAKAGVRINGGIQPKINRNDINWNYSSGGARLPNAMAENRRRNQTITQPFG